VRRAASDEDRRVKVIELTPKGARLRAAFMERMAAPPEGLERLSVREQQTLVGSWRGYSGRLSSRVAPGPGSCRPFSDIG
jgi:DNA-binding MarR family transcriptional regulator